MRDTGTETVEQTLRIAARPETVWGYWTDPRLICEWWGATADLDPQPGGTCRVVMSGGHVMRGEFLELVPHERIVFSFGWETGGGIPAITPSSTRVEITLVEVEGDTVMTLRHSGIPIEHAGDHRAGWSHFLPHLAEAAARSR